MTPLDPRAREVPLRALILSCLALAVPVTGALVWPGALGEYGALLWLMALVPAFLLAYYRSWRGVATALAVGMVVLSLTQVAASLSMLSIPDTLLGVVVAYLAISMAVGFLADRFHRDRGIVEDMAFTDPLTRLPNRRHAMVFLDAEFAAARRGRLLSVVLFDLDRFKGYNDQYGHQAGDEALRAFGGILSRNTRRMNLAARFGGEEFLVVLAGSDTEGAFAFADRVRMSLQAQHLGDPPLTVSAGIASFREGMHTVDELLAAADEALYEAKRQGRNRVLLCDGTSAAAGDVEPGAGAEVGRPPAPRPGPPGDEEEGVGPGYGEGYAALVLEEDEDTRLLLRNYLQAESFRVEEAVHASQAGSALEQEFDVVLTSLRLPDAAGQAVVRTVKSRWPTTQVVVMTGLHDSRVAADALQAGADRYLFKPFGMSELRGHLVDALARRERLLAAAEDERDSGEDGDGDPVSREREDQDLEALIRGTMALVKAVEVRDPYTRGHSARVGAYAAVLADVVDPGRTVVDRDRLHLACELHDVGKIGIPDKVLNKRDTLDEGERDLVRQHPEAGRMILEPLLDDGLILDVVHRHHERWDGTGYPDGLQGEDIPLPARVVGLADVLDAMTCPRAYRDAVPWGEALARIRAGGGTSFDPVLVDGLPSVSARLERVFRNAPRAL